MRWSRRKFIAGELERIGPARLAATATGLGIMNEVTLLAEHDRSGRTRWTRIGLARWLARAPAARALLEIRR